MKRNLRVTAALAGAVLLVLFGVAALFWVFGQIDQAASARQHSRLVAMRAADFLASLIDAETGQRGFALTGDDAFLEPYLAVRGRVSGQLGELRQLTKLEESRRHLDAVRPLMDAKMGELARSIQMRRSGDMAAVGALVASGEGKRSMDSIRTEIGRVIEIENLAFEREVARFETNLRRLFVGIVAVSLCFLLLGALAANLYYRNNEHRLRNLEVARDIEERRKADETVRRLNAELEQRVIERTAELKTANTELEAFSYSVSHDLRTPVRAIDGYTQAVLEDYGPQLPAEGLRFLQTIRHSARHLGALIDNLLAFAQLKQQELNKHAIDTNALARTALDELGAPWPSRQVDLRVADLPPSFGDPALLKQVWLNLISNALKYTNKRDRAEIEIGCLKDNGADAYFVRDNGTGFDMRYADKLFGVFQRFHRAEDYEGTGVGLAIVQRIVSRHGGRIWADAAVDRGATFNFTLEKETKS